MDEIAEAVGVSTPTIFNYFGNKDGILIAMITEGAELARDEIQNRQSGTPTAEGADFGAELVEMFVDISTRTMDIASKRVWRYAEAASIRHPQTTLAFEYAAIDAQLGDVVASFLDRYELSLRSGTAADVQLLAKIFYDVWNATFLRFLKDDDRTLTQHRADLRGRLSPLANLLFTDDFCRTPPLKPADRTK